MLIGLLKDGLDFESEQILVISYAQAIWLFIHAGYLDFSRIDGPLTDLFAISEEDQVDLERRLRELARQQMVDCPMFGAQSFATCFLESFDAVDQAEIDVPNEQLYY